MELEAETKTETERKVGTIYSWNEKGFALIFVTHKQRFFMHISEWDSIAVPIVGDRVSFEVAPPRKADGLPCAVNVKLVEDPPLATGTSALAGTHEQAAVKL